MQLLKLFLQKFLLTLLAIQILNLSIYNSVFYEVEASYTAKDLPKDANPVDSFAELIVESVDGCQDAFPEPTKSNEKQTPELKHNVAFKMIHFNRFPGIPEKEHVQYDQRPVDLAVFQNNYSYLFWKEINHPPA
ncbi:hypothetical protein [Taibaiella chishuiensis]|uniref:hypothetical protein n=1 Tax=Taibaiella chishuiensis TaxID=1434707 RepID=UPI0011B200D4|nr:hypothetical protein [Taibaiella chishuiensis]